MNTKSISPEPVLGWAAVFGSVVVYDLWAIRKEKETLSSFYRRISRNRVGRIAVNSLWMALTWHLMLGHKKLLAEQHRQAYAKYHPVWIVVNGVKQKG